MAVEGASVRRLLQLAVKFQLHPLCVEELLRLGEHGIPGVRKVRARPPRQQSPPVHAWDCAHVACHPTARVLP